MVTVRKQPGYDPSSASHSFKHTSREFSCGATETNPTRNHEVAGSSPGLAQWVKDPELLWRWCRSVATAPIGPVGWEPPYASDMALNTQTHTHTHTRTHTHARTYLGKRLLPPFAYPSHPAVALLPVGAALPREDAPGGCPLSAFQR